MASGDTQVTISNTALRMLGANAITSFTDGSDAAAICSALYPNIKDQSLGMYPWSFAKKKVTLSRSATAPTNEWQYAYPIPSNVLNNPFAVYNSASTGVIPITNYEIYANSSGGRDVYTNDAIIVIDYIDNLISEGAMPKYFIQLMNYMMAWHLAEPVTDQIQKAEWWRNVTIGPPSENGRGGYIRQAMNIDGKNQPSYAIGSFPLTESRN